MMMMKQTILTTTSKERSNNSSSNNNHKNDPTTAGTTGTVTTPASSDHNNTFHHNTNTVILADQVILRLKQHLYQLYWNQPVKVMETKVLLQSQHQQSLLLPSVTLEQGVSARTAAARIRLFLTGTKLWNSSYA